MNIIKGIPPKLPPNTYCAWDSEFRLMNEKTLHRPTSGVFALLTVCYQPGEVWYIDREEDIPAMLDAIDNTIWLIHNAKFDITQMRRYTNIPPRTKLIDTYMMERILWNGYYDHFDEQSLARRYLHEHLDKSLQKAWGTATEVTQDLLEYACRDSETLLRIWYEQKKYITKTDMQVYKTIDLPALWAVLEFKGFRVDRDRWLELSEHHRKLSDDLDLQLPINPRSPKQVKEYLREHGFKGLPSTGEDILEEYGRKYPNTDAAKWANLILADRGYRKLASTYGKSMLDNYAEEVDGCTYFFSDFHVIGAATGRFSASSPNLQNIPVRDTNVFRECFIPKPGNDLVIGDYSQQEIFIMAYLSQDEALMEICNSGGDVYIRSALVIYGLAITKDDLMRKKIKALVLGTDYGMSKFGLAKRLGCSLDEAEKMLKDFFHAFPKVKLWMDNQDRVKKFTTTVLGRKAYLNPYTNKSQRNAYNNPIQGTAADIMKMSLSQMYQNWKFDYSFGIVATIHDELVADVPKEISKDVAEFMKFHMEDVANKMLPGMKFIAEVFVSQSWSKE